MEPVKRGANDVSAQIAKLQAAKPEVVFLVLTPGPGAQAIKERQKIGWTDTIMVSAGPLTDERYLGLAGDASEGVEGLSLWPDPAASDLPGVKVYREAMAKYFRRTSRTVLALRLLRRHASRKAPGAPGNLTRDSSCAGCLKGSRGILPRDHRADHETPGRDSGCAWTRPLRS